MASQPHRLQLRLFLCCLVLSSVWINQVKNGSSSLAVAQHDNHNYKRNANDQAEDVQRKAIVFEIIKDETQEEESLLSTVHFVYSDAPLLSHKQLDLCQNATDPDCKGGVAAVAAYLRHLVPKDEPSLVLPKFQKNNQFVMVHPMGWNINRVILQGLMQWNVFMSTPSLLAQDKEDNLNSNRDLSYLKSQHFPFLISNVNIPPSNSWESGGHHEHIHFDPKTRIALMVFSSRAQTYYNTPTVSSAYGLLNVVKHRNEMIGAHCRFAEEFDPEREQMYASYEKFFLTRRTGEVTNQAMFEEAMFEDLALDDDEVTMATILREREQCWIPVVAYHDTVPLLFDLFVETLLLMEYPPAVILDFEGNNENYSEPALVFPPTNLTNITISRQSRVGIWVHSYKVYEDTYLQHHITINDTNHPPTVDLTYTKHNLKDLPEEYKDEDYGDHMRVLCLFADEAIANDLVVGQSTEMVSQRQNLRVVCNGGECASGNLFCNAMAWQADADVAFSASGGFRGDGWPAGDVHLSHIWSTIPFPNTICTGKMSGLSLFMLLDYSVRLAKFTPLGDFEGDRLLQVSGMKIVYNPTIPHGQSRLVSVDVWDREENAWKALEATTIYSFATDSYICTQYDPYPDLTGHHYSFTIEGEEPGIVGDVLIQDAVVDYLKQLSVPYNTSLEGRIVAAPNATKVLDLVEGPEDCKGGEFFSESKKGCLPCPDLSHVVFSKEQIDFKYQLGRDVDQYFKDFEAGKNTTGDIKLQERLAITNNGEFNVTIFPKQLPPWLQFISADNPAIYFAEGVQYQLAHGRTVEIIAMVDPLISETMVTGTALGTVSVGVVGEDDATRDLSSEICDQFNLDLTFDVTFEVLPQSDGNHLGNIRFFGLSLMVAVIGTAIGFAIFVYKFRENRIVQVRQPKFLIAICVGLVLISLSILPKSFDDAILTEEQCDIMCAIVPWLLSTGYVIVFSILFSKLWRINRLFHGHQFRHMEVKEKDVIWPFLCLFSINLALLIGWTVADPLQWVRQPVPGEEWKTWGSCRTGDIGYIFTMLMVSLLVTALLLACWQAYKARDISDEFSESKQIGMALFTWVQALLVGTPSYFLVADENFGAHYFLIVVLIFVLTESMLLLLFVPLVVAVVRKRENSSGPKRRGGHVAVTGLDYNEGQSSTPGVPQEAARYQMALPLVANNNNNTFGISQMKMPRESDMGVSVLSSATPSEHITRGSKLRSSDTNSTSRNSQMPRELDVGSSVLSSASEYQKSRSMRSSTLRDSAR